MKKIVILFSGNGTNLEAIAEAVQEEKSIEIVCALSNKSNAYGIKRAEKFGIKTEILEHTSFSSREEYDKALVATLKPYNPDLIVLAGFMRILTPIFVDAFKTIINIHPSLLPLFKGANAIEQSFNSDMKVAGVTVHKVTSELDAGEILAQECFSSDNLTCQEFNAKIKEIEHRIYPKVVKQLLLD